jgi:hypothetical protein
MLKKDLEEEKNPSTVFPISPAERNLLISIPLRFSWLSRGGKYVQQRQRHLE